jgi:hypothetical protein
VYSGALFRPTARCGALPAIKRSFDWEEPKPEPPREAPWLSFLGDLQLPLSFSVLKSLQHALPHGRRAFVTKESVTANNANVWLIGRWVKIRAVAVPSPFALFAVPISSSLSGAPARPERWAPTPASLERLQLK